MSDAEAQTDQTAAPRQEVAIQPRREVRVVDDAIAIFDTAKFEHMARVARMMAQAPLTPASLRGSNEIEGTANCVLVVDLADRWGFSPFAVAQCASVQFGRLMLEGKLVTAALDAKLGVELHYYYDGDPESMEFRVYVADEEFTPELIAKLSPSKPPPGHRVIDGNVKNWHTKEKSGAVNQAWIKGAADMLAYRGARQWARRYKSAIMLGVYTEDEMEDLKLEAAAAPKTGRGARVPMVERLAGPASERGEGFNPDHVIKETTIHHDAETGEIIEDPQVEGTDSAPTAESEPATSASATAASTASPEAEGDNSPTSSEPQPDDGQAEAEVKWPTTGQIYFLASVPAAKNGSRQSFKNGKPHAAMPKGTAGAVFEQTEAEMVDYFAEMNAAADRIDEINTAARAPKDEAPQPEQKGPQAGEVVDAEVEDTQPGIRSNPEDRQEPEGGVMGTIRKMRAWDVVKAALGPLYKTEDFLALDDEDQAELRRAIYAHAVTLDDAPGVDKDVSFFRLWVDTLAGPEDAAILESTFGKLEAGETFKKMPPASQEKVRGVVTACLANLRS